MSTTTIDFDAIIREHRPLFVRVAYNQLENWADADEAVQNALLKAWTLRDKFDPDTRKGSVVGWIASMVKWEAKTVRNSRRRYVPVGEWETEFGFEFEDRPVESNDLPCIAEDETRNRVMKALHRLPARERQAVELHAFKCMSTAEVGEVMGISGPAVGGLLRSALARINGNEAVQADTDAAPRLYHQRGVDSAEAEAFRTRPELLDELTPRQQDVIRLRYLQQMPIADVAKRLGISQATVRWTTAFARRALYRAAPELVPA